MKVGQMPDNGQTIKAIFPAAQHYRPNPRILNRSYWNQNQNDFLEKANQNDFINQQPFIKWVPETDKPIHETKSLEPRTKLEGQNVKLFFAYT